MHTALSNVFDVMKTFSDRKFMASAQHIPVTIPKSINTKAFSPFRCKTLQHIEILDSVTICLVWCVLATLAVLKIWLRCRVRTWWKSPVVSFSTRYRVVDMPDVGSVFTSSNWWNISMIADDDRLVALSYRSSLSVFKSCSVWGCSSASSSCKWRCEPFLSNAASFFAFVFLLLEGTESFISLLLIISYREASLIKSKVCRQIRATTFLCSKMRWTWLYRMLCVPFWRVKCTTIIRPTNGSIRWQTRALKTWNNSIRTSSTSSLVLSDNEKERDSKSAGN